jgi:transposase
MQDNDPKHVSRSTKQCMEDHNINHWVTPPESPDMNPIANIWTALKYHIRRRVKPRNQDVLLDGIVDIYCFTSRSRIFHLYGDVTTAGEGKYMYMLFKSYSV